MKTIDDQQSPISEFISKARYYKTAQMTVPACGLRAHDYVSVEFSHATGHTAWFMIRQSQHGVLEEPVMMPSHHLTNFVL